MKEYIHIGFSKSGSTYLQSLFSSNTNLNYTYKTKRFSLLNEQKEEFLLSQYLINIESDEHILLPSYHPELKVKATTLNDIDQILDNIHNYNSKFKIIVVIRNHFDLLMSRYSQYIIGGGDLDIDSFVTKLNGFDSGAKDYFQNYYHQIIEKIIKRFGEHNLLVLLFEDLKNDKKAFLNNLNTFLGVDLQDVNPGILNMRRGLTKSGLEHLRKLNRYLINEKQNFRGEIKAKIPNICYIGLVRLIRFYDYWLAASEYQLSSTLNEKIKAKFEADNAMLASFLNRDINKLGYFN